MKKYIIIMLSICAIITAQAQTEQDISSSIKRVTVYPTEAQIVREESVELKESSVLLKFNKLSPYIQEKSIRVKTEEGVRILNVSFQEDYLSKKEIDGKTTQLQSKIDSFKLKQEDIKLQTRIINDKKSYLSANQTKSRQSSSPAAYKEISQYFSNLMKENEKTLLTLTRKSADLQDSIYSYQNQIRRLNNNNKEPEGVISVLVNTKKLGKSKFELSYLVNRATWKPSYDIRFEGFNQALLINQKAEISQQTGNNWNNVLLSLSTAETQKSADIPSLHPLYLGYVYKEKSIAKAQITEEYNAFRGNEYKAPIIADYDEEIVATGYGAARKRDLVTSVASMSSDKLRDIPVSNAAESMQGKLSGVSITESEGSPDAEVNIRVRGGSSLTQSSDPLYIVDGFPVKSISDISPSNIASIDVLKDASATAIYGAQGANGVIIVTTKDAEEAKAKPEGYELAIAAPRKPTSSTYEVKETQTINSDFKTAQVPFREIQVDCLFEYKAIPKLSDKVYLMARIPNWSELNLQQGEANLYFENAFIGKSVVNPITFTDTLSLSFGVDQGISIKREKIKDFTETVTFGGKKQQTITWRIVLKNNKKEAVKVDVFDQIPLTKQDDSSIKALELTGGKINETTGEVHWPVNLDAGESKDLLLTVQIKYPKGKRILLK